MKHIAYTQNELFDKIGELKHRLAFLTETVSEYLHRHTEAEDPSSVATGFMHTMEDVIAELNAVETALAGGELSIRDIDGLFTDEACS